MNGTLPRFLPLACLAGLSTLALAQNSSSGQCTEEFIQHYVLDDSVTYATVTPCPEGDLNSTPAWPLRREEIHKEYTRDDFYTRLTKHDWHIAGLINHGGAKSRTPRVPGARYEITPFGVECLRVGSMCMPVMSAPKCRAELYLMPIEATVPVGDKTITGRTTRLDLGSEAQVDRNSWVMP